MLGNIISQLYRIADLLKDKRLVDKNSNDSSQSENEIKVKPVYLYDENNTEVLNGIGINEKYFNKNFTEGITLKNIFPIIFSEIYELLQRKNFNDEMYGMFNILIENSTSIHFISYIRLSSNKYEIYLDYNDKHYTGSSDSLENIGDTELIRQLAPNL